MHLSHTMPPTLIKSSGPSGQPQFHNHTTSGLPSRLSETVTTTANAVVSSQYASTNTNTSSLPFILAPILAIFGLGGLYFLWHHFNKRRKAKHVAPSAEFQKYRRRSASLADVEGGGASEVAAAGGGLRYAHHDRGDEKMEGRKKSSPPSFAPHLFQDT